MSYYSLADTFFGNTMTKLATKKTRAQYTIAVLGGGSFGTALSDISAANRHHVRLWVRSAEQANAINVDHVNHRYLPELLIHSSVSATTSLKVATEGADIVFIAIPILTIMRAPRACC